MFQVLSKGPLKASCSDWLRQPNGHWWWISWKITGHLKKLLQCAKTVQRDRPPEMDSRVIKTDNIRNEEHLLLYEPILKNLKEEFENHSCRRWVPATEKKQSLKKRRRQVPLYNPTTAALRHENRSRTELRWKKFVITLHESVHVTCWRSAL